MYILPCCYRRGKIKMEEEKTWLSYKRTFTRAIFTIKIAKMYRVTKNRRLKQYSSYRKLYYKRNAIFVENLPHLFGVKWRKS